MRKLLRDWLFKGWDWKKEAPVVQVPVEVKVPARPYDWRDGPIKLTEEQFAALVAGLNMPDAHVALLTRRVDGLEMRITRLDESAYGALNGVYQREIAIEKRVEVIEGKVSAIMEWHGGFAQPPDARDPSNLDK